MCSFSVIPAYPTENLVVAPTVYAYGELTGTHTMTLEAPQVLVARWPETPQSLEGARYV
jgi:hypothetical protein